MDLPPQMEWGNVARAHCPSLCRKTPDLDIKTGRPIATLNGQQ